MAGDRKYRRLKVWHRSFLLIAEETYSAIFKMQNGEVGEGLELGGGQAG